MAWLIDGSNVLGVLRADLAAAGPKRDLARLAAGFARARRTRVVCYFDGPEPPDFARHLGAATIIFSARRPADDLIVEQAAAARDAKVVTADRGLAARVATRRVEIVTPQQFLRDAERAVSESAPAGEEDWEAWFSDPNNRL